MKRLNTWFKSTGIVHKLVLYRCDHLNGLYGVRVPFWINEQKLIDVIVDQVLEHTPYELPHAVIHGYRSGRGIRVEAVW